MTRRRAMHDDHDGPFGVVVLAAGSSTRLGRTKQLVELDGRPLIRHVIDAALAAGPTQVVVVLGHDADAIAAAIGDAPCELVRNDAARDGQATSLAVGVRALDQNIVRAVVVLGDEPRIDPVVIACVASGAGPIRRARYRDRPGHPIAFDRALWHRLQMLSGDEGARSVLLERPDQIREVYVDADAPLDLDTEEDARALGVHDASPPQT